MTESELRKKVVSIVTGWVGGKQGSTIHKEILKIWNNYAKSHGLSQAYENYAWCDITVSAAWIKAGIADYVPISMSCGQSITLAKKLGIYKPDDGLKPRIGDACLYDWEDDGKGDATGHDHIGIVVSVGDKTFSVVEGNAGRPSQVRKIQRTVNQRYISGFICPDYKAIAKRLTSAEPVKENTTTGTIKIEKGAVSYTVKKGDTLSAIAKAAGTTVTKLRNLNKITDINKIGVGQVILLKETSEEKKSEYKKTWTVTAPAGLNIRTSPEGTVLTAMKYGEKCSCDGQYKKVESVTWLHVTYGKTTGWSSSKYLK